MADVSLPVPTSQRQRAQTWLAAAASSSAFGLLLVLFAAARLLFLTQYSLAGGELFALTAARMPWAGLFSFAVADVVHPPLFYVLLKLWITLGGESLLWLKLLAVVCGAAIVIPFLLLCRELRVTPASRNLALLFLASDGFLIHYTQELRMYGLFATLALVSLWLFLRDWRNPAALNRYSVALFVTNLALIYTHYYGWVVIAVEGVCLVLWRRPRLAGFVVVGLLLAICFSPWAVLVTQKAIQIGGLDRNLDWIPHPTWTRLASLFVEYNGSFSIRSVDALGLVLFGFPLLGLAWASLRPAGSAVRAGSGPRLDPAVGFWMLLLVVFLPCAGLFLVSQSSPVAVWIDRYFVFAIAPYLLAVAIAIHALRPGLLRRLAVIAVVAWSLSAGLREVITNQMAWQGAQVGTRVQWASLARRLSQSEASQSDEIDIYTLPVVSQGLLTGNWIVSNSLPFYLDAIPDQRFRFVYARDSKALLSQQPDAHFWVAYYELGQPGSPSPENVLAQNGYRLGEPIVVAQGENKLKLVPAWKD